MGNRYFSGRAGALDLGLAGFAACAFAFAAFALPEWRLAQAVGATGLPDMLAAAQPPLGLKARLGVAALAALLTFAASFALLRLADRAPARTLGATEADAPPEPIRLRRADAHPDAPVRRPLVAGRDLGEPQPVETTHTEEELVLQPDAIAPPIQPLPAFLVRQTPETVEIEPVVDDAAEPAQDVQPAPPAVPEPQPEPIEAEPIAAAVEPAPIVPPLPETPAAEVASVVEPAFVPEQEAAEPLAGPTDQAAGEEPSISLLMQRLEFGLARKERAAPLDPAAVAPPADDAVGHRLRSAINDLQKLAVRG